MKPVLVGAAASLSLVGMAAAVQAGRSRRRSARLVARFRADRGGAWRRAQPPRWFAAPFEEADFEPLAGAAWRAAPAALCTALLAAAAIGDPLPLLLAVACVASGALALGLARGRRDRRYEASLPAALDLVARSLRSGSSLRQALAEAGCALGGPVGRDLADVARRGGFGERLADAVAGWSASRPSPGVRLVATALALGAEAGGAQARAIDGVAATLRDRLAIVGETRALTSQARLSATVIALAPVGFCLLNAAVDRSSATFLFRTPLGLAMLAAGLTLDGLAVVWMHRLTRVPL